MRNLRVSNPDASVIISLTTSLVRFTRPLCYLIYSNVGNYALPIGWLKKLSLTSCDSYVTVGN